MDILQVERSSENAAGSAKPGDLVRAREATWRVTEVRICRRHTRAAPRERTWQPDAAHETHPSATDVPTAVRERRAPSDVAAAHEATTANAARPTTTSAPAVASDRTWTSDVAAAHQAISAREAHGASAASETTGASGRAGVRDGTRQGDEAPRPIRIVRLVGADARNRWQACTLLEPFDRVRPIAVRARGPRVVSRSRWMRTLAGLVASAAPPGCPASAAAAGVTLMPHQIVPLLAVLGGKASRLLLADGVGLGKTIQAALLLRELRARDGADRVLVLVPPGLRDQWQQELAHRVGLRAAIVDARTLAARVRERPPDVNPWTLPGIAIASLDFVKQARVLRGADAIAWDVLIVDEAHNLGADTDRVAAVDTLARHSRLVVLLTATPHHGSDDGFAALCRVGVVDARHGDPIAIVRRTRSAVGLPMSRRIHVLRVARTREERWLDTLLRRYARRVHEEDGGAPAGVSDGTAADVPGRAWWDVPNRTCGGTSDDVPPGAPGDPAALPGRAYSGALLALSVLIKRASSSASSLERSVRRRLDLLEVSWRSPTDAPPAPAAVQAALPFGVGQEDGRHGPDDPVDVGDPVDGGDDPADREPGEVLGAPGLRDQRVERAWLKLLIAAARNAARGESKPRALVRWLRRTGEAALVYTEYRDTLQQLARTLAPNRPDGSCAVLHGGLGAEARRAALSRFASGEARILLTTDAAGEGLNMQQRCRLVLNVELPWNPNRLEQRIGRVDRLGQTRTVHAVHLVAAGTPEEQMLDRLTGRVRQIAATLGDAPAVLNGDRTRSLLADARHAPTDAPHASLSSPSSPSSSSSSSSSTLPWSPLPSSPGSPASPVPPVSPASHVSQATPSSMASLDPSASPGPAASPFLRTSLTSPGSLLSHASEASRAGQSSSSSSRSSSSCISTKASGAGGEDLIWIDETAATSDVITQLRTIRAAQTRA